ncbi:MAG: hypothetical protein JSW11_11665 [Candidatus Heimdallarchaeota archaeon]|nr:MAG: hypothetical protein JSW11_11665 [Candidatus Heimdallarchaeota archaeon]
MTVCSKCRTEIRGEKYDRSIFIPPAIFVPQTFCEECFHLVKQRDEELVPLVLLALAFILIPLLVILLS